MMPEPKPPFIRRGLQVVPASRLGWAVMLGYVLVVAGGSIALFAAIPVPGDALVVAWMVAVLASALAFTLWSWRVAEVIAPPPHGDEDYWFVPKLFGFGATPVTWQGWALLLGTALLLGLDLAIVEARLVKVVIALGLIVAMIAISAHKTAGGWRWRWGTRD